MRNERLFLFSGALGIVILRELATEESCCRTSLGCVKILRELRMTNLVSLIAPIVKFLSRLPRRRLLAMTGH